jgi:hypothetical protein
MDSYSEAGPDVDRGVDHELNRRRGCSHQSVRKLRGPEGPGRSRAHAEQRGRRLPPPPSRPGTVRYTPWRTRVHRPVSGRWRTARYVMPAARHCCRVTSPRCWSTTSLSVARSVGVGGPPSTGPNARRSVTVPRS